MDTDGPASPAGRPRRGPRRLRRIVLRALTVVVALAVGLTAASLAYNAATTPPRELAAPGGRDVTVDGLRVHYEQWPGPGRPVVLVHGFAESTAAFGPGARELARTHAVYAVDLAGYGYTERSGHYALADQVALVDGFIRALGLDHPVVVGHSLGAAVVGGLALAHPEHVGGVIFLDGDALPFTDRARSRRGASWSPFDVPFLLSAYRFVTRSPWLADRLIAAQCGQPCRGLEPGLGEAWVRPFRQGVAEQALPIMLRQGLLALTPEQVRQISVPRAIIWGGDDPTSGGSLDATRTNLGHPPERIIPGAGHVSMIADPAGFAAAVTELVAGMG